ncbi:MAG: NnrS family protein [Campylobacteraceae bacterium]|nr:NnrS family protein [Campylobacteraceae bacterium]
MDIKNTKNDEKEIKNYATSHYAFYPKGDYPALLAYGFRPIFILLAPYIVLSILLWSLSFSGFINISFMNDALTWHMYEMLYGLGTAGILAFFLTGVPEMFPGAIPIVGKKLLALVSLWVLGRVSFWMIDYVGVYFVALTNISLLVWITALVAKPVFKDVKRNHFSLAYMLIVLISIQIWFFSSSASLIDFTSMEILKVALGAFIVLILLALRRVSMESINELLEDENIDETFYARSPRYNLAIFSIILYTIIEFLYPDNSILAWLAFASAAATLGVLNDFILKDYNILLKPFVMYLMSIIILIALGYGFLGYDYLNDEIYALNHFRHFLTTGAFGLTFYIIMLIVSTIHTGRHLFTNIYTSLGVILIILSSFIRAFIPYYENYMIEAYIISSVLFVIPFIIYMKIFFPYLLAKRVDGLKG